MVVRVDATGQYADWFEEELSTGEQMAVVTLVKMLQDLGVLLDHPYSSKVWDSRLRCANFEPTTARPPLECSMCSRPGVGQSF
jgi:hypothetical protein